MTDIDRITTGGVTYNIKDSYARQAILRVSVAPDYSAGESRDAGTTYTATKNGWVIVAVEGNKRTKWDFYVSGQRMRPYWTGEGDWEANTGAFQVRVSVGDTYVLTLTDRGNYAGIDTYAFYPDKVIA